MDEQQLLIEAISLINANSKDLDTVGVDQIVSHRIADGNLALIVDRGIKGSPKYTFPVDSLYVQPPEPAPKKRGRKRRSKPTPVQRDMEKGAA